jgi:hypothetical protein
MIDLNAKPAGVSAAFWRSAIRGNWSQEECARRTGLRPCTFKALRSDSVIAKPESSAPEPVQGLPPHLEALAVTSVKRRLLTALWRAGGPVSRHDLLSETGVSREGCEASMPSLIESGAVVRTRGPGNTAIFCLRFLPCIVD